MQNAAALYRSRKSFFPGHLSLYRPFEMLSKLFLREFKGQRIIPDEEEAKPTAVFVRCGVRDQTRN